MVPYRSSRSGGASRLVDWQLHEGLYAEDGNPTCIGLERILFFSTSLTKVTNLMNILEDIPPQCDRSRVTGVLAGHVGSVEVCALLPTAPADQRQLLLPVLLPHQKMLPNGQPLLVDAHNSDVAQSFLIDLTLFG